MKGEQNFEKKKLQRKKCVHRFENGYKRDNHSCRPSSLYNPNGSNACTVQPRLPDIRESPDSDMNPDISRTVILDRNQIQTSHDAFFHAIRYFQASVNFEKTNRIFAKQLYKLKAFVFEFQV